MRSALLLTAACLALTACNSNSDTPAGEATMATEDINTAGSPGTGPAADPALASGGPQFVNAVAASDLFELESSKLAQTMASSKAVKDFAAMMVTDHTRSTAELKRAALGASPSVAVTPQMNAAQQADLEMLRNATGNFDKQYARKQVAAHEAAKTLLSDYSAVAPAGPLRDFASRTVSVVSGHLEQARKLPQ